MRRLKRHTALGLLLGLTFGLGLAMPGIARAEGGARYVSAWGSILEDGMDSALVGEWELVSAVLRAPEGEVQWPSAGHRMRIAEDGAYVFDYSTARYLPQIGVNGTNVEMPRGTMFPDFVTTCVDAAQFTGRAVGRLDVQAALDLDWTYDSSTGENDTPDTPDTPLGTVLLAGNLDKAASVKPKVSCGGGPVTTAGLFPIGVGRPTGVPPQVLYSYEMTTDVDRLTIENVTEPALIYTFQRVN